MNQKFFQWSIILCFVFGALHIWYSTVRFDHLQEDYNASLKQINAQFERVTKENNILKEKVSILDESILPAEKRWAKIKKIREAIVTTIKTQHYPNTPDVQGLTYLASAVLDFSEQYDVAVPLILAVIRRESAFNTQAVSHAGAKGLMQLMDPTAKECANDLGKPYYSVFKIRDNIQLGVWYLAKMLNMC
jgi:hypothetical protein